MIKLFNLRLLTNKLHSFIQQMQFFVFVKCMHQGHICNVLNDKVSISDMNNRKNRSPFLKSTMSIALLAIFTLTSTSVFGQGWEKFYGDTDAEEGSAVVQTRDGGFAMAGYANNKAEVIRTDQNGNIEWKRTYEGPNLSVFDAANDIIQTSDDGFIIAGTSEGGGIGGKDFSMTKLDRYGNEEWTEYYGGGFDDEAYSIIQTSDGGFALTGYLTLPFNNPTQVYVVRTDADGDVIWEQTLGGPEDDRAWSIIQTADSGFMVAGEFETGISNDTDIYLMKLDASGLLVWENTYHQSDINIGNDIVELPDGSFVCAGIVNSEATLLKTNADGSMPTWFTYGPSAFNAIQITTDNNLIMTGTFETSIEESNVSLVKTDFDGNQIWSQTYGRDSDTPQILISSGADVKNTLDGGYVIAGYSSKLGSFFDFDSYLIKVNSLGEIYTNYVEGIVFDDINGNCIKDSNEPFWEDWVVEASGEKSFYGTTDENGKFFIIVDNGNYDVSLIKPNDFVQTCINSYDIDFISTYDTIQLVFPVQEIQACPLMQVDISTTLLEKCENTDYVVKYSNLGTSPATGAEVKVTLDEFLMFNSAELPYTNENIDGDLYYVFNVGDVDPMESGSFKINVLVDCSEPQLQQTHCVTALIFPDTLCGENNPAWDESSLKVTGECDADSVRFNITNIGDDMDEGRNWIVIEDNVMLFQEPETVQLTAGASKPISYEANGSTYRIIAEQSQNHPGASFPTLAVEGCVPDNSTFSTGFHNMFPEDDNDLSKSVDCQENVNADDVPNQHKKAYPTGYDDEHCITNSTEINYHIRFQNTGVDSVDRVIVRDTLSDLLDISTVELGASSHDFTFEIYDERILKFTFDNIMLPDSSTNEAASNGFVKFRVSQKPENSPGTIIYNSAAIYFDFDRWINTDEVYHTICDGEWPDIIDVSTTKIFFPEVNINVFPNPFIESATFEMTGMEFKEVMFNIYDLQGRLMRSEIHNGNEFQFNRNQLSSGLYVYRIESEGQPVAVGKIVIE